MQRFNISIVYIFILMNGSIFGFAQIHSSNSASSLGSSGSKLINSNNQQQQDYIDLNNNSNSIPDPQRKILKYYFDYLFNQNDQSDQHVITDNNANSIALVMEEEQPLINKQFFGNNYDNTELVNILTGIIIIYKL